MSWCFGIVNNKLAEVYFEKSKERIKILGHCYIKEEEYKTKKEKRWITEDIKKVRLVYRNNKYRFLT